jgi:hypothetical protein
LRVEFDRQNEDIESSSAVPSAGQPRYPPAGSALPQRPDREQEARLENYGYGNTGAGGFTQGSTGQWGGMNSPNAYGSQNLYASPPRQLPSYYQNAPGPCGISYSSLPRSGFPGARGAQPGFGGQHGASNQSPAPSGYQGQYRSPPSQHQSPGGLGQTMQSMYPGQFSSAGQHVASPMSLHQLGGANESGWQTQIEGSQYYSGTQTEQSVPPHSTQPYSVPLGNVSPSEVQVDSALASQVLYAETPSPPAQDEMSTIEPATLGDRRQPMYRGSRGAGADLSTIEPESEIQTSHEGEPDSEVTAEVTSFQMANQQRSQNTKST